MDWENKLVLGCCCVLEYKIVFYYTLCLLEFFFSSFESTAVRTKTDLERKKRTLQYRVKMLCSCEKRANSSRLLRDFCIYKVSCAIIVFLYRLQTVSSEKPRWFLPRHRCFSRAADRIAVMCSGAASFSKMLCVHFFGSLYTY